MVKALVTLILLFASSAYAQTPGTGNSSGNTNIIQPKHKQIPMGAVMGKMQAIAQSKKTDAEKRLALDALLKQYYPDSGARSAIIDRALQAEKK